MSGVVFALLHLCVSLPSAVSAPSAPKLAETTQITEQLRSLDAKYVQELADEKSSLLLRASRFDSARTSTNALLEHSHHLLHIHTILTGVCSNQVNATNATLELLERVNQTANSLKLVREQQRGQWEQRTFEKVLEDNENIEKVSEVMKRVDDEIASPNVTRGDGIGFDKFVKHHPNAVKALHDLIDQSHRLTQLIRDKINHTQSVNRMAQFALQCLDCDRSLSDLRLASETFQRVLEQAIVSCDTLKSGDAAYHQKILEIQTQLRQLDEDEQTETKQQQNRQRQTTEQLMKVREMIKQMTN
eukprot:c9641_g1_i4.p1 GENE.c9641_g1_i4~~c9641_g1_i4.p1  ORF type:complete len:302 (+),score=106.50 c9641_g1_i4:41-946(+)